MHVLDHHQHRALRRHALDHRHQRLERLGHRFAGRQRQGRITTLGGHRQQGREHRRVLAQGQAEAGQRLIQLVELLHGAVVFLETQGPLELLHDRMQRRVLVVGRAEVEDAVVQLALDALLESLEDTRLADTGLAGEQHHLAVTLTGELPAPHQQTDLLLAPHERRDAAYRRGLEAALGVALAEHPPGLQRLGHAPQVQIDERLVLEQPTDQLVGARRDHERAGLRGVLQAGGEIRRLSDDGAFLRGALADDLAGDHEPGGDAHAHGDGEAGSGLEVRGRLHDAEPGAHRAFRVVLVRLGIAEVGQHAVTDVARDEAVETLDDLRAAPVVGVHDLAQVFRIELLGERGGPDQIAEHDGELAALRVGGALLTWLLDHGLRGRSPIIGDRCGGLGRRRRRSDGNPATAAECFAGLVGEAAGGANQRQRGAAGGAEASPFPVIRLALGATYRGQFLGEGVEAWRLGECVVDPAASSNAPVYAVSPGNLPAKPRNLSGFRVSESG